MEIFISWSGERSKLAAQLLKDWLPNVIQALDPFISEQDIEYGTRWLIEISNRLATAQRGLICVTPDNPNSPWLMFETGALAKSMDSSRVVPILIGLEPSQLPQGSPLSHFQGLVPTEDAMWRLIQQINASQSERQLAQERLRHAFDANWQFLADGIRELTDGDIPAEPRIEPQVEMTTEILGHVRRIVTELETIKTRGIGFDQPRGIISRARERAGLRGDLPTNFLRQPLDRTAMGIEGLLDAPTPEDYANGLRNFVRPEDGD